MSRCRICGEPATYELRLQGYEALRAKRVWFLCAQHGREMIPRGEREIHQATLREDEVLRAQYEAEGEATGGGA